MSEKQATFTGVGEDEQTELPVNFQAVVDFINPGFVYLDVRGAKVAIPDATARQFARWILNETREA